MHSGSNNSQFNYSFSAESPIFSCIPIEIEESVVSADYWKLIKNDDGYNVEYDGENNLKITDTEGNVIKTLSAEEIATADGATQIQEWFVQNGLGEVYTENIANGFNTLGQASVAWKNLEGTINNSNANNDFLTNRTLFLLGMNNLLNSGLDFSGLQAVPDQDNRYALMNGDVYRTTLYGNRLKIPAISGISGEMYHWGDYEHLAEDYSTAERTMTNPMPSTDLDLNWSNSKGLGISLFYGDNVIQNNHTDSLSISTLVSAMLSSNSTSNIAAGINFGVIGTTGSASSGNHNHLETLINGSATAPSNFFTAYGIPQDWENYGVDLTGYANQLAYDTPSLLADVYNYSQKNPQYSYVYEEYKKAHGLIDYYNPETNQSYIFNDDEFRYDVKTGKYGWGLPIY